MTQVLCDKIISRILIDAFMKADWSTDKEAGAESEV